MNIAYIDMQNIKLAVREIGTEIDRWLLFQYLKKRYKLDYIKLFVGYLASNKEFYDELKWFGYIICFKSSYEQDGKTKGNVDTLLMQIAIQDFYQWQITKAYLLSWDSDFDVLIKFWKQYNVFGKVIIGNHKKIPQLFLNCTIIPDRVLAYSFCHLMSKKPSHKEMVHGVVSHWSEQTYHSDGISILKNSKIANDFSNKDAKIYIAGHRGLVGSALLRQLQSQWYSNIITRTHAELDLTNEKAVAAFFASQQPAFVFLAAAKVGWILANNTHPADFLYQNLQIQNNVIHQAYLHGVSKLLFLGSSCIYPKNCPQPIKEEYLLTGPLEPTNEPYAIAKITGIKMCQSYNRQYGTNFIACMPTNLYGPGDNFDLQSSHVLPALIRKFHEAKILQSAEVVCRGNGEPMREFLYVDDMADGCIHLMKSFNPTKEQNEKGDIFVNIGTGEDITIKKLAELVGEIIGYTWTIVWDTSKPNGTMKKLLDVKKLEQEGWKAKIGLEEGITKAYQWFLDNQQ